ncbi:MurR/RpiR family transcriptional regulator [Virgibacillus siamensis]|uniref:MurR/RpiR family transcriptional regulator n=1 Tax=Virgibacillus siamensis TaxID=480071 RepID=UPI001589820F|nr:MurR/RpiR family transcriptional regulator [Virgibacillus siamensis]
MEKLYQKIREHQSGFSRSFKKIAAFLYRDPSVFAMNSAKTAGKLIGVSETTIIRFAHELGYKGYSALQKEYRTRIFQKSSLGNYRNQMMTRTNQTSIKDMMLHDITAIQTATEQISDDDLERAVANLINAESIIISGVKSSFALANWFALAMDIATGNARQYIPGMDSLKRIGELNEQSVFVAFSYHRYGNEVIRLAKAAKQHGATVISFTDNAYSPVTEYSDIILALHMKELSTLDIVPAVFSLMNSIVSTIALRNPACFQRSIEAFDSAAANDFFMVGREETNDVGND